MHFSQNENAITKIALAAYRKLFLLNNPLLNRIRIMNGAHILGFVNKGYYDIKWLKVFLASI